MLKRIIPIISVSMTMAAEYPLPEEAAVSEHFMRLKNLRAEQENNRVCDSYENPNELPTAPLDAYNSPLNRTTLPDTVSIPINYHLIYVGGDSVYMNLQVDNQPYEHCMWDIWSYDNNTFLLYPGFGWDYPGHSYSLGGVLTPGNYALFIYDDFGTGGVSGTVTTSDGTVLATLTGGSYSYYTFLQFTAPEGSFMNGLLTGAQIEGQTTALNTAFNDNGYSFYTANIDSANNSGWYYATASYHYDTGQWNNDDQYLAMASALGVDISTSVNFYFTGEDYMQGMGVYPWSFGEDDPRNGLFCSNYTIPGGDFPYHLGITGVHEVGHYFGLYHTFENGCSAPGDEVDDTPYQIDANYGCPSAPQSCGSYDDVGNYMDYMDDDCLEHFTSGQVDRIDWALNTYRPLLIGGGTNEPPDDFALITPSDDSEISITSDNVADNTIFFWSASQDSDGDSLEYILEINSDVMGNYTFSSTSNLYNIINTWFIEKLGLASASEADVVWNVVVTDGADSVVAMNGPYVFNVEAYAILANEHDIDLPNSFVLYPAFPNPFNPITTIRFSVEAKQTSHLQIYDISGQMVATLVHDALEPGLYDVQWNADQHANGVYFAELVLGNNRHIQKLILLK